ncbi:MAG: MerC domain-containing protein [Balneolaceae bacterium]
MSDSPNNISIWDRFGIGVSVVCAIHCLLFPVVVALLPVWPALGGHYHWVHPLFLILILPTVFYAARRSHYDRKILRWLLGGLLLVTVGWVAGHLLHWYRVEPLLTLLGSVALVWGHWKNYRHHQACTNRSHHHHPVAEEILGESDS